MNVPPGQSGRPDTPGNGAGRNASEAGLSPEPGWLLRHRVTVPEPPAGYCERRQLASRFVPTRQRVTVFAAPGGFGKTTLLAAACCSAMARGVPVAWLTLAEEDDPAALDAYIAFACRRAGIDVLGRHGAATRTAKARFLRDPRLIANFEVLTREVALERDGLPAATDGAGFAAEFYRGGNRLQHYASTAEVALERALRWGGVDAALSALDDMWAHARKAELQTLDRLLAALRVSLLADAGRATEAGRTWRDAALPATDTGCLNLDALGWREMEAIACARLRLLIALGAYGAGRRLADAIDRLTAGRGLLRMRLRALALRVRLEQIAGAEDDARPFVAEYLRLYAETDYAWPMVTAGAAATAALTRFVRVEPQGPLTASAGRLLGVVQAQAVKPGHTRLTGPELEVLRRLPVQRDKQIAAAPHAFHPLPFARHNCKHRRLSPTGANNPITTAMARDTSPSQSLVPFADEERSLCRQFAAHAEAAGITLSPNTERAVRADLALYADWCRQCGFDALPATAVTIATFVDAMAADRAPATVRRYVASIAIAHRTVGREQTLKSSLVKLALKRMHHRKGRRQQQAHGLTWPLRKRMLAAPGDRLIDVRNRALLAVAYDALLRRSELSALEVADFAVKMHGGATVLVRRAKTDPEGSGHMQYIARDTAAMVLDWLRRSALDEGPLFRSLTKGGRVGGRLDPSQIPRICKGMARRAGVPDDVVASLSGHSARVGAAQDMIAAGIELPAILQAGRWKSTAMVNRYGEGLLARRSGAAQLARIQGRD